jgi:hypothetical protein
LVRRVKRHVRCHIPRPHELKSIKQQLVVNPEDGRGLVVVVKLKVLVIDSY